MFVSRVEGSFYIFGARQLLCSYFMRICPAPSAGIRGIRSSVATCKTARAAMATKRRGLLRNVCIALGNVGDRRAIPALTRATQDPEPLIAEHAAWALGRIGSRREPSCFNSDQPFFKRPL